LEGFIVDDLKQEIVIDLTVDKEQLNESFLRQMGTAIELLLKRMFGLNNLGFQVRGSKSSIRDFAATVAQESSYMKALQRHGLSDPSTFRSKADLDRAVSKFETSTGIKWPLK
jgi:hypothetical protein